jgi:hypothetical protein
LTFSSGNLPVPGLNFTGPDTIPLVSTWLPTTSYSIGQTVIFGGGVPGDLDLTAVGQVVGDSGGAEDVAADRCFESGDGAPCNQTSVRESGRAQSLTARQGALLGSDELDASTSTSKDFSAVCLSSVMNTSSDSRVVNTLLSLGQSPCR